MCRVIASSRRLTGVIRSCRGSICSYTGLPCGCSRVTSAPRGSSIVFCYIRCGSRLRSGSTGVISSRCTMTGIISCSS